MCNKSLQLLGEAEARGLVLRVANAGLRVLISSRNLGRAQAAAEIRGQARMTGHTMPDAVSKAAILTVPLSAQGETLESTRGSFTPGAILADVRVPVEIAVHR